MSSDYEKARLLYSQERWSQAIECLNKHLAVDPDDAYAWGLLALCEMEQGLYGKALESSGKGIACNPNLGYCFYVQATILYRRKLYTLALEPLEQALKLEPLEISHLVLASWIYFALKEWERALLLAEEALAQQPDNLDALNARACILVRLGRGAEAENDLLRALEEDPECANTLANLGWLRLEKRSWKEAVGYFQQALALEPELEWARDGLMHALRSRYPIYGWILAYFIWMEKHSAELQRQIMLASLVGARVLRALVARYPALGVFVGPVLLIWRVFSYLTWTIRAATTLMLRCTETGRLLLTRKEILESNLVGALWLAFAAVLAYHTWIDPFTPFGKIGPYVFLTLPMLIEPCFSVTHRVYSRIIQGITAVMAILSLGGLVMLFFSSQTAIQMLLAYFRAFGLVVLLFQVLESMASKAPLEDKKVA